MVSKSSKTGGNKPSNKSVNIHSVLNKISTDSKPNRIKEQEMNQVTNLDDQVIQKEPDNISPAYKSPEYQKIEQELAELKKSFNPLDSYDSSYTQGTTMYDNRGKYFDPYEFNKKFDEYIEKQSKIRLLEEKLKLNDLNTIENIKIEPYQLPFNKMLIGLKDTWYNFYDAIINKRNPFENFSNDDIFYFSITLILIALIYVLLSFIFE
jgi:hypothetical protein